MQRLSPQPRIKIQALNAVHSLALQRHAAAGPADARAPEHAGQRRRRQLQRRRQPRLLWRARQPAGLAAAAATGLGAQGGPCNRPNRRRRRCKRWALRGGRCPCGGEATGAAAAVATKPPGRRGTFTCSRGGANSYRWREDRQAGCARPAGCDQGQEAGQGGVIWEDFGRVLVVWLM